MVSRNDSKISKVLIEIVIIIAIINLASYFSLIFKNTAIQFLSTLIVLTIAIIYKVYTD
jgi:hypothetical protein